MTSKQRDNLKAMPLILRITNAAAFDQTHCQELLPSKRKERSAFRHEGGPFIEEMRQDTRRHIDVFKGGAFPN